MIRTYLKVAVRQLFRNKFYSLLNIIGLSIGLAACLLISLYVQHEMSYDQFHVNKDRIYRISEVFKTGDGTMETALTAGKLAEDLDRHFEEISNTALVDYDIERYIVKSGEKRFTEENVSATGSSFFSVFSFPLLQGNPATVLDLPYTVAISDKMAEKYFAGQPPIGKVMEFIDPYDYTSFQAQVTGVFASMPDNAHFHKDFFLSAKTAEQLIPERKEQLGWTSHFSYLLLSPRTDAAKLEKQINEYIFSHYPKEVVSFWAGFHLQSLNDIHLRSNLKEELEVNGDLSAIYIFSAIGLFIILLAGIARWICGSWYEWKTHYMEILIEGTSNRSEGIKGMIIGAIGSTVMFLINAGWISKTIWITLTVLSFGLWAIGLYQRRMPALIDRFFILNG